jgi:hypothetical protein
MATDSNQMVPNTGFGMTPAAMPSMGWGGQDFSAMAPFMPNAMGNFQNPMGTFYTHLHKGAHD